MLLQDMYDKYWSHGSTDYSEGGRTNSGSIKLYGHQRKAQEQIVSLSLFGYAFHNSCPKFQDSFVKMGQALRLESKLTGGGSCNHVTKSKFPSEPQCVFPNFPHRVLCGDSWGNRGLLLGTSDGLFLVTLPTKQLVSLEITQKVLIHQGRA